MAYALQARPSALREIAAIPVRDRARLLLRIEALASDPRPPGSVKMAGKGATRRIRSGDYRILYSVDDGARTVTVEKVGHRGDVYRR